MFLLTIGGPFNNFHLHTAPGPNGTSNMRDITLLFWFPPAGAVYADTLVLRMSGVVSFTNNSAYDGGETRVSNDANKPVRLEITKKQSIYYGGP